MQMLAGNFSSIFFAIMTYYKVMTLKEDKVGRKIDDIPSKTPWYNTADVGYK